MRTSAILATLLATAAPCALAGPPALAASRSTLATPTNSLAPPFGITAPPTDTLATPTNTLAPPFSITATPPSDTAGDARIATSAGEGGCGAGAVVRRVAGGEAYKIGGFSEVEHTYICAFAGGVAVEIGEAGNQNASSGGGEGPNVQRLVFAGEIAGVAYTNENGSRGLEIVDLATGHVRFARKLGGGKGTVPGTYSTAGSHRVGRIVVKRDGSAAWTQQLHGDAYEVVAYTGSHAKALDRGGEVRPHSLTLSGSTLRWLERDGERRSATLR